MNGGAFSLSFSVLCANEKAKQENRRYTAKEGRHLRRQRIILNYSMKRAVALYENQHGLGIKAAKHKSGSCAFL